MEHSEIGFHLPAGSGRDYSEKKSDDDNTEVTPAQEDQGPVNRKIQQTISPFLPVIKSTTLEIVVFALAFMVGWLLLGKYILPPHPTFTLVVLFLLATALGRLLDYMKVVGLLGMLVAGLIVRNGFSLSFDPKWSSNIRLIALAIILLSGGLGLKWDRLKAAGSTTLLLAFVPAPAEALAVAIVAHFLLGMPFLWSFLLGFGLAAVSPAVVVPIMIKFIQRGLGTDKRIPTIIIAASGVDDILGVTGFTILVGYLGTPPDLVWTILKPPLEIIGGILVGVSVGYLCTKVFKFTNIFEHPFVHFFVTVSTAAAMMLGGSHVHAKAAGALAVLIYGMTLSFRQPTKQKALRKYIQALWKRLAMPLLFSLIGEAILCSELHWLSVGYGVVIIFVGLVFRSAAAYTAVSASTLTHKERLYVALAWMPKATVQAVMASLPLDVVGDSGNDQDVRYARQILSILALSIFLTAPTAAFIIERLGPVMLHQKEETSEVEVELVTESSTSQKVGKAEMKEDCV